MYFKTALWREDMKLFVQMLDDCPALHAKKIQVLGLDLDCKSGDRKSGVYNRLVFEEKEAALSFIRLLCAKADTYNRALIKLCGEPDIGGHQLLLVEQIEAQLVEIVRALGPGYEPIIRPDPRGGFQIKLPSGRSNNLGGETWTVPTRGAYGEN